MEVNFPLTSVLFLYYLFLYFFFRSYADVGIHEEMLNDVVRTNAYRWDSLYPFVLLICFLKSHLELFVRGSSWGGGSGGSASPCKFKFL